MTHAGGSLRKEGTFKGKARGWTRRSLGGRTGRVWQLMGREGLWCVGEAPCADGGGAGEES